MEQSVSWNYTTWLNIGFIVISAALLLRFVRTGGVAMLSMMGGSPGDGHGQHAHTRHPAPQHSDPQHPDSQQDSPEQERPLQD